MRKRKAKRCRSERLLVLLLVPLLVTACDQSQTDILEAKLRSVGVPASFQLEERDSFEDPLCFETCSSVSHTYHVEMPLDGAISTLLGHLRAKGASLRPIPSRSAASEREDWEGTLGSGYSLHVFGQPITANTSRIIVKLEQQEN